MSWLTLAAVFFVIWWVSLFALLSRGLRTQEEAGEVTPGTVASAPAGRHIGRVFVTNTIVALVIFALFYLVTVVLGYGIDDLPRIVPDFG